MKEYEYRDNVNKTAVQSPLIISRWGIRTSCCSVPQAITHKLRELYSNVRAVGQPYALEECLTASRRLNKRVIVVMRPSRRLNKRDLVMRPSRRLNKRVLVVMRPSRRLNKRFLVTWPSRRLNKGFLVMRPSLRLNEGFLVCMKHKYSSP
jgi:hypothetical protein